MPLEPPPASTRGEAVSGLRPVSEEQQSTHERELKRLRRRLGRQLGETCERFGLLAPGDRILVGLSGGKDSYTLLDLLLRLTARLPFEVELWAVHLDQVQPGHDPAPLVAWLRQRGVRFEVVREDTYSVVTEKLPPGATYCSLCSRLRRGILYTTAERLGCNKLALGHHRDDALETFLLNLFFSGKLQAMPPRYRTDDGRFEVVRPLLGCAEADIARYAELSGFPILPCNLCGSQEGLQRQAMKRLLDELQARHPHVRSVAAAALGNVRPTHLMDQRLLRAWEAFGAEEEPSGAHRLAPGEAHHRALPVLRGE